MKWTILLVLKCAIQSKSKQQLDLFSTFMPVSTCYFYTNMLMYINYDVKNGFINGNSQHC